MTLIFRDTTGKYVWNSQLVCPPVVEFDFEVYSGTSKHVIANPFYEQQTYDNFLFFFCLSLIHFFDK